MGAPRIAEEASATFVVNLPELGFGPHVHRIVTLLAQHGYRAIPMSKAYVLEMAEQVRQEIADENATARILEHAASNAPTETED